MKYEKILPYILFLFLDFITFLILNSDKYKILNNYSSSFNYPKIHLSLSISSYFLLLLSQISAGEIEINSKGILERQISLTDPEVKLNYTPLAIMRLMPCNGCKSCKIYELPLRSYHCKKCERCIRTFDHHCVLIGGCIGEDNHFIFCLFLFIRILSYIFNFVGLIKITSSYSKIFIILFFFVLGTFDLFLAFYLSFHIYLILTNQTTHEVFNKSECPYLRIFKQERLRIYKERGIDIKDNFSFRPFDCGIKENSKYALFKFFNRKEKMKWEEIYFKNLKTNHVELNICDDNKYLPAS